MQAVFRNPPRCGKGLLRCNKAYKAKETDAAIRFLLLTQHHRLKINLAQGDLKGLPVG